MKQFQCVVIVIQNIHDFLVYLFHSADGLKHYTFSAYFWLMRIALTLLGHGRHSVYFLNEVKRNETESLHRLFWISCSWTGQPNGRARNLFSLSGVKWAQWLPTRSSRFLVGRHDFQVTSRKRRQNYPTENSSSVVTTIISWAKSSVFISRK